MKNLMKNNKLIIGMVHLPPLPGTPEFQNAFNNVTRDPDLSTGSKFQDN